MHTFISKLFITPFTALLSQVGHVLDDKGIFVLIVVTLALLIGVTVYFVRHKRTTTPVSSPSTENHTQE